MWKQRQGREANHKMDPCATRVRTENGILVPRNARVVIQLTWDNNIRLDDKSIVDQGIRGETTGEEGYILGGRCAKLRFDTMSIV
jgi:hypothetical protein